MGKYTLAMQLSGQFKSAFASPVPNDQGQQDAQSKLYRRFVNSGELLTESMSDAQLVVISSTEFVSDQFLEHLGPYYTQYFGLQLDYQSGAQFMSNLVEWMTSDLSLASLRKRGPYTRVIRQLNDGEINRIEMINYACALISLLVISALFVIPRRFRAMR